MSDLESDQQSLSLSELRRCFSETLHRVQQTKERVVVTHRGKAWVAIVPVEDLEQLETMEDRLDLEEAREALADIRSHGAISWTSIKRDLDL